MEIRHKLYSLFHKFFFAIIFISTVSCNTDGDFNHKNTGAVEVTENRAATLFDLAVDSLVIRSNSPVGSILAAVHNENSVYLLDGIGKQVVSIASSDGNTSLLGGNGRGPGEYLTPSALEIHNDKLWLLDRNLNRINQYISNDGNWLPDKSGSPRIRISDLCFAEQSGLWVYGSDGENVIHRVSSDMMTSEFSTGQFNADDPIETERMGAGRLACNEQFIVAGYTMDNRIRLYDSESGELIREIIFEEIVPIELSMIQRDGVMTLSRKYSQGVAFDENGNYQDNLAQILFIDDDLLIQYRRSFTTPVDEQEHYVSYWVDTNEFSYTLSYDTPWITDYLGDGKFLVAYNNPEPVLVLRSP